MIVSRDELEMAKCLFCNTPVPLKATVNSANSLWYATQYTCNCPKVFVCKGCSDAGKQDVECPKCGCGESYT